MQKLASSLINKNVLSFHSGYINGKVCGFLVNQDTLKIELLEIQSEKNKASRYLLTKDIRSANDRVIIIDSEDDITDIEDLIRQKELIKSKYNVIGSKVITQDAKYLGKVKDFSIDYDSFDTLKLYLKASLFKRILNESFIIDRKQIIDIKAKKIIVRSTALKSKEKSPNILQAKAS